MSLSAAEIRSKFLQFFKSKGHVIVPSAPIVVKDDPTLLFTNAGMNQFKDYFLGNKVAEYSRVTDTQKCLRVSGKHNDLEEVGVDTYHHTMFEMLGNWSFGNPNNESEGYFKKEAIAWSWELLTEVYNIPKDRLYVTVFEGDEKENIPQSTIALNEWKKLVAEDRIIFGNKKDNFWEMGETGPCGPCSEIHVDCRTDEEREIIPGRDLVNQDHPQVIEIWNNVFIQYNRKKDGQLEPLPAKHVDTGMGFERLVRVLQGKKSNYDTDVFSPTIELIGKITSQEYKADDSKASVAFRVIADHIRAIAFSIADGQLPSNTGAGYVIRRILRRAVRYYYSYLDYKQPLIHQLIEQLATQFEHVFPELKAQSSFIQKVIKEEEEGFLRTLDKGLKRIDSIINSSADKTISGKDAFELLDTYGFPIDLTRLIATEQNMLVDEQGYEEEMQQQKNRSRAATAMDTEDWVIVYEGNNLPFVGYEKLEVETKILRYRKVKAKGNELYQIVLEATPFYAESGGQVGDKGTLKVNDAVIEIIDTKKENDLFIHLAASIPDQLSGTVTASVHKDNRSKISKQHSVTHLMHAALRQVLGTHVAQKGSLVNDEYLRFDFSHFAKMTEQEIQQVEQIVNEKIRENIPVVITTLPKEEAIAMGAMALFGEKYGNEVRVVVMDKNYSIELCGGTHVGSTGEIGFFKIKSEAAIAAGVRRIEAVAGFAAEYYVANQEAKLSGIIAALKNSPDPLKAISQLQADNAKLSKHIEMMEARQLVGIRNELLRKDEIIGQVTVIADIIEVPSADSLKKLATDLNNQLNDYLLILCANIDGKASVAIAMSATVSKVKNMEANKIIKEIVAPRIKGGGGGTALLATAGGQSVSAFAEIIAEVKALLSV